MVKFIEMIFFATCLLPLKRVKINSTHKCISKFKIILAVSHMEGPVIVPCFLSRELAFFPISQTHLLLKIGT
jgi:hypothetical protein